MVFDNLDLSLDHDQLDATPSFGNLCVIPLFFLLVSLAVPNATRRSLNIRRAIKRYDAQPAGTVGDGSSRNNNTSYPLRSALGARSLSGFIRLVVLGLLSVAFAIWLLAPTATWAGWFAALRQHGVAAMVGAVGSTVRPFSSLFLYTFHPFAMRSVPRKTKDGQVDPKSVSFADVNDIRTELTWLPKRARAVLDLVRPLAFALLMAKTGVLVPVCFLSWLFYRAAAHIPFCVSLRRVLAFLGILVALGASLTVGLLALISWLVSDTGDEQTGGTDQKEKAAERSTIWDVSNMLVPVFLSVMPLVAVLAAACNYDVHRLEQAHGSFEAAVELVQAELEQKQSERLEDDSAAAEEVLPLTAITPSTTTAASSEIEQGPPQTLLVPHKFVSFPLDKNGKYPEPVFDENALTAQVELGELLFNVYCETARGARSVPSSDRLRWAVAVPKVSIHTGSSNPPSATALPIQYSVLQQIRDDPEAARTYINKMRGSASSGKNSIKASTISAKDHKAAKAPKLDLPMWNMGLLMFQNLNLSALYGIVLMLLFGSISSADQVAWLHPIHIVDLLFSPATAHRIDAIECLAMIAWCWMGVCLLIVVLSMVAFAALREGAEGVRALWTYEDSFWWRPPSSSLALGGEDVEAQTQTQTPMLLQLEEQQGKVEEELLIDVRE
ncbi:hypothetical protein OC842_002339 [Tilletia horrida]|uniref:Uncharacterized protein n=1 Tax=Tilletia horrida TaxID=155126 RepID=A0AAN6JMF8_9BASI|nr:hypothetical protein OC842_002339 [Tilletia horrida]